MFIYVQTPPVNFSNDIAHLIEHCIHNRLISSIKDYFINCDNEPEIFYWYTKYTIHGWNYKNFIEKITQPLNSKNFHKESLALQEELDEKNFINIFRWIINHTLWYKKEFKSDCFKFWEIVEYHKKWYNHNHFVLTDEHYNVLQNAIKVQSYDKRTFSPIKHFRKKINGEKDWITILPYAHWKDQILADFVCTVFDAWWSYYYRGKHCIYYSPCSCIIEWENYVWVALPVIDTLPTKYFFEQTKKYYCELLEYRKARENAIINLLYINQLPSNNEMIDFVRQIPLNIAFSFFENV